MKSVHCRSRRAARRLRRLAGRVRHELSGAAARQVPVLAGVTAVELAISKIARLSGQDREDVATLARAGLVKQDAVRRRAERAVGGSVGGVARVRTSIDSACRVVEEAAPRRRRR